MSIEFSCSQCGQKLRVSDEAAGKRAKCPKCSHINQVPASTASPPADADPFGSSADPFGAASDPFGGQSSSPFGGLDDADYTLAPEQPKADAGFSPFGGAPGPTNPYASPQAGFAVTGAVKGGMRNVQADVGSILNYSVAVWQKNLGILVGATVTLWAINFGLSMLQNIVTAAMQMARQEELAIVVAVLISLVSPIIQFYLTIGFKMIMLKLARGRRAEFADLFNGGPRFLPTLGVSILFGLALFTGTLLLIIPGILLALMWWPCVYLVVDEKANVLESFSVARVITQGNMGTTFLLWLTYIGILLLGCLALCVGYFFAFPLASTLFAVAYLMMSGQIPLQPQDAKRLV